MNKNIQDLVTAFNPAVLDNGKPKQKVKKEIVNDTYYSEHPETKDDLKRIIKQRLLDGITDLNDIDVSKITDFSELFADINDRIQGIDISLWIVSNGRNFSKMFKNCTDFNCDIINWDVSSGEKFTGMFTNCSNAFNQDLSRWNVSNAIDLSLMFQSCEKFNGNVSTWKPVKCKNFYGMFANCISFNQPLNDWDVS